MLNIIKQILKLLIPQMIISFLFSVYYRFKYGLTTEGNCLLYRNVFGENCYVGKGSEIVCSEFGRSSYVANNSSITFAKIGNYCAIGDNVRICLGNHPTRDFISIHPCFYSKDGQGTPSYVQEDLFSGHKFVDKEGKFVVEIGNDVWIGNNVSILDGIKIGDGAIIGIGSIVTKDVESYSIVGGVPAKIIKKRFAEDEIEYLRKLEWWNKSDKWIKDNAHKFSSIKLFMNNA